VSHRASVKRVRRGRPGVRRQATNTDLPTGVSYISIRKHKTRLSAGLGARTTERDTGARCLCPQVFPLRGLLRSGEAGSHLAASSCSGKLQYITLLPICQPFVQPIYKPTFLAAGELAFDPKRQAYKYN